MIFDYIVKYNRLWVSNVDADILVLKYQATSSYNAN